MDRTSKILMAIAVVLFFVIIGMTVMLFMIPATPSAPVATSTPERPIEQVPVTPKPAEDQPLSARVKVNTPAKNSTVGSTFAVTGEAPGNWFFEADFPIQVRDKDSNVIARTFASALGEWMTTKQVGFTSTVIVEGGYKGPATLILIRNNPSGLPEHDDAVEVPIVIN